MIHDVGLLYAAIKLNGLTMICFPARSGFILFMWPLCGVIFGVILKYFTLLRGVSGAMQQAYFSALVVLSLKETTLFFLHLPAPPLSGLVGEAASPPFILLTQMSRLASALSIF